MSSFRRIAITAQRAWVKALITGAALLITCLAAACSDSQEVAGGSSGVDNPELTVGFLDSTGTALRVTGDLDVYAAEQNPAVDAEPLVTIKVKNSSSTSLSGSDFARVQAFAKIAAGLAKPAAAGPEAASAIAFNLILKTQDRTGTLVLGLRYDSLSGRFTDEAGDSLRRIDVKPRPLVEYEATVVRDSVHGDAGRIFIPGTPFLATLVDSTFTITDMPEGTFPVRLLCADGKVYPMGDSLNTKKHSTVYRPAKVPVDKVDTTGGLDSIPDFTVSAGPDLEAYIEVPAFLEAGLSGADEKDPRLSYLWRQLPGPGDSGHADTTHPNNPPPDSVHPPKPGGERHADILKPAHLRTEVRFKSEGVYRFEIAATLGLRVELDTVVVSVRRLPPLTSSRIIQPSPGDSLLAGNEYSIQWEMPNKGPVTVQLSLDSGATWLTLASGYSGNDSLPIFPWTPDSSLGESPHCQIQVISEADSTVRARMAGRFNLFQ